MNKALFVTVCSLLSVACSQSESLNKFDEIRVSDPKVVKSRLVVEVVNNTGDDLCYFEDGLFFGPNSIEGSTGKTELGRPAIGNASLEDIKFATTGRTGFKLVRLPQGKGKISIDLSDQDDLDIGDDLSFDLIFCDPEADGLHRSLVYSSRLQ